MGGGGEREEAHDESFRPLDGKGKQKRVPYLILMLKESKHGHILIEIELRNMPLVAFPDSVPLVAFPDSTNYPKHRSALSLSPYCTLTYCLARVNQGDGLHLPRAPPRGDWSHRISCPAHFFVISPQSRESPRDETQGSSRRKDKERKESDLYRKELCHNK